MLYPLYSSTALVQHENKRKSCVMTSVNRFYIHSSNVPLQHLVKEQFWLARFASDISSSQAVEKTMTKLISKRSWPVIMAIPLSVYALLTSTITAYLLKIHTGWQTC